MNPEFSSWAELRTHANMTVSPDLGRRVLARVGVVRQKRREVLAAAVAMLVCLLGTGVTTTVVAYKEQQKSLTQWNELVAVTQTIDRGL